MQKKILLLLVFVSQLFQSCNQKYNDYYNQGIEKEKKGE